MEERRKLERFDLALPATIEIVDPKISGNGASFDALTRDVSSGGAFFLTTDPLPVATRVMTHMSLKAGNLGQRLRYPRIKATGHVVRTEPTGIAVCFNSRCRFVHLQASNL